MLEQPFKKNYPIGQQKRRGEEKNKDKRGLK
jgi:hypothetical protein